MMQERLDGHRDGAPQPQGRLEQQKENPLREFYHPPDDYYRILELYVDMVQEPLDRHRRRKTHCKSSTIRLSSSSGISSISSSSTRAAAAGRRRSRHGIVACKS